MKNLAKKQIGQPGAFEMLIGDDMQMTITTGCDGQRIIIENSKVIDNNILEEIKK